MVSGSSIGRSYPRPPDELIREFNPCHAPDSGRFCSEPGSASERSGSGERHGRPTPVKVKSIDEAVDLILAGKVVELAHTKDVNTVLKKLAAYAIDAEAKGEKAPNYNLCNVSVAGTNLFCSEKLRTPEHPGGIPRTRMPQLGGDAVAGTEAARLSVRQGAKGGKVDGSSAFIRHLTERGISTEETTVKAAKLKASQAQLVGPKVAGMMVKKHYDPSAKTIFISRDFYVIDGHHRWAATVGRDAKDGRLGGSKMRVIKVDAPISEILPLATAWSKRFGIASKSGKRESRAPRLDPQSGSQRLREPVGAWG